jgi:dihydrofolate reductase
MRRLGLVEFVTLDGVMQSFGGPREDREGGFEYGGWGGPYIDEVLLSSTGGSLQTSTVYLLGRKTYEAMAAHWPFEPPENRMAANLNQAKKYVATRTLKHLEWANSEVLEGELAPAVEALKTSGDGHIVVLGSGRLVESLHAADLVDEYKLFLHPLLLGKGKRLFREFPEPKRLRLVSCTPTTTGVLMLDYAKVSA